VARKTTQESVPDVETGPGSRANEITAGPRQLAIASIDPNPDQPRREFKPEALEQLARSIKEHGVLQPVVVRRAGERFELIMGERRFRASQLAGQSSIPAVIADVDPADRLELAIVENVQRQDLNPVELALAYQALADTGHTQEEIGRKVSMDRSSVANHLRLLDLSRPILTDLEQGKISMGHAKALLQVSDLTAREKLRQEIARQGLSVRATEKWARDADAGRKPKKEKSAAQDGAAALDADTRAFVESLERRLQTKVTLHPSSDGSGRLEIRYFNLEDLERVGGMLLGHEAGDLR
jgi:ParB family chromosome partitioning protein